ncbi:spore germination protein D [Evansella vedderi]|uniref:Spore germination protein D n=1 Tax=Evansella vedderi TaxID=38282 RepID=A0ABU0A021_9BACI|nr:spore germination lipoprotein GerD [Evansella vedderi]MDQ0256043.1 spore germination protein D [Evansella vedderi]
MVHKYRLSILCLGLIISFFISGCAAMEEQSSQQPDYESTKKMMVDMLKTDEGKQAIKDVLEDDEVKSAIVMEQDYVTETIRTTLTSEAGKEYWQSVMQDPEFAQSFAQSMQQENERILKSLMKDPEYQGMMISILKDPEMEEEYLELMQSKEYRQQVMNVMTEAFESPYFIAKLNEIMSNVAEEQMQKKEEEKEKQEQEGDSGEE